MSQAIRFNKGVTTNTKKTTKRAPSLEAATLKYGQTHALPATESHSVLIFTEDTGEMFMGMGSQPIKKLSDVLVFPTINDFPAPGVKDRLYIAESTNTLHFWDGTQYQTAGTGSATITVTPRIFEFDSEKDFPATGVAPAIYIEKSTGKLFRFENGGYVALGAADETPSLKIEIQKLQDAMLKLQADKADKGEGITTADAVRIAKAEAAKISVPDVSGLATKEEVAKKADATELLMKADKKELAAKADKIDLDKKADKADLDAKADKADVDAKADKSALDGKADKSDLLTKADKADLDNKADKADLDSKADKADLDKKADKDELDKLVQRVGKVEANAGSNVAVPYDDKALKDRLDKLEADAKSNGDGDNALADRVKALEDAGFATLKYTEATYVKKVDLDEKLKPTNSELKKLIDEQLGTINNLKKLIESLTNDVAAIKAKQEEAEKTEEPKEEPTPAPEEPQPKIIKMVGVESMSIPASFRTIASDTPWADVVGYIPKTATVTMEDGSTVEIPVTWESSSYDPEKVGEQTITGVLTEVEPYKNTAGLKATCTITVAAKAEGLYAYKFQIGQGKSRIDIRDIHPGLVVTDEEYYGENLDGKNPSVQVFMITNTGSGDVETPVPFQRRDFPDQPEPESTMRNGATSYDSSTVEGGTIYFEMGSDYPMNYVLRKLR